MQKFFQSAKQDIRLNISFRYRSFAKTCLNLTYWLYPRALLCLVQMYHWG